MKKLFSIFLLTLLSLSVSAQYHKVTLTANPSHGGCVNFTTPPSTLVGSVDNYKVVTSTYNKGDIVDCYAVALEGFRFTAWKQGNAIVSTDNPMTFVMGDEDLAYEAVFVFNPLSPSEPGSNYFNPETGEVRIINTDPNALANGSYYSDSERAGIYDLIKRLTNDIGTVKSLTLIGQFPNLVYGDKFLSRLYNLESVDLSRTNIKYVGGDALSLYTLETVILPASLTEMDSSPVFAYEGALKDVYCYAPVPPQATRYSFITQRDTLTWEEKTTDAAIHVPIASVPLYKSAEGWKDLDIVPIEDGTLSITVQLPAEAAEGSYQNMSLVLEDRATLLQTRYTIGKQAYCVFTNLPSNTSYHLRLENAFGQALGEVNNVPIDEESVTVAFPPLKQLCNVAISVKDLDGNDLTEKAQVKWTMADGTVIGQHPTLSNVLEGTSLVCKVLLGEELAISYSTPAPLAVTVQPGNENKLTCQLQPLSRVTLTGKVVNGVTKLPLAGASVVLRQMVGGLYNRSSSTTTDEEGRYSLPAYSENGTLSFSSVNCFTQSIAVDAPTESETIETVALQPLSGAVIDYVLTYTPTVAAGETPEKQENYSDNNVCFEIYNLTKRQSVTQFVRQNNQLIITDGAGIGDELRVTMTSLTNNYSPVTTQCVIDDTNYALLTLDIIQRGCMVATPAEGSMAGMGLLYDSSGQLLRQGVYNYQNLTLNNLPEGDYTLVSIGATTFKSVLRLSSLAETGLTQGTDYLTNTLSIHDGQQTNVNVGVVHLLENGGDYTVSSGTYFMGNQSSMLIGDYETLKARIQFKPEYASRVSNVQLVVDLPDGVSIVPGSLDGYQLDGQRITINSEGENYKRFCVTTANVGSYRPSAFVRFTLDGEEFLHPIGTAFFETKRLTFGATGYTQSGSVNIWGNLPKALRGCDLQIFDNGVMVWQGLVPETGKMEMETPLYKPLNNSWHGLTVKVFSPELGELETNSRMVQCYNQVPILEEIVMDVPQSSMFLLATTGTVSFYKRTGKASSRSYTYFPTMPVFTFRAYFSDNDPEKVQNLWFNIFLNNGKVRRVKGTYDAGQNCWVCNSKFTSTALPVNVTASYNLVIDDQKDYDTFIDEQGSLSNQTALHVKELMTNHMTPTLLEDEESHCSFVMANENGQKMLCETAVEDYEAIEAEMFRNDRIQFVQIDDGVVAFTVSESDEGIQMLCADSKERFATRIKLSNYNATAASSRKRSFKNPNVFDFGDGVLGLLGLDVYFDAEEFISQLLHKRQWNMRDQARYFNRALNELDQNCLVSDDGVPRAAFTLEQKAMILNQLKEILSFIKQYEVKSENYIAEFRSAVLHKGVYDIGILALGVATGMYGDALAAQYAGKNVQGITKIVVKLNDLANSKAGDLIASGVQFDVDAMMQMGIINIDAMFGCDIRGVHKEAVAYMDEMHNFIMGQLNAVLQTEDACWTANCRPQKPNEDPEDPENSEDPEDSDHPEEPEPDPDPEPDEPEPVEPEPTPSIDPQGYVYEGVPSNRLAGATATVYFKELAEDQNGNPVEDVIQWDSAPFGQVNPQITGADGMYQWFVPKGLWQVKVEKEGYETAYSEWLPVPPPQLDVNIAMKQSRAPEVKDAKAYEEGINITFDKYMLPSLLTTDNISVLQGGDPVEGTIEMQDKEATESGDSLVSKVRFVPETPFNQNKVTLCISRGVQSYAYMLMPSDYEQELDVELEVKELKTDSIVRVTFGESTVMSIKALPVAAAAGKTVKAKVANAIAAVNDTILVLSEQGEAQVEVTGRLLGETVITFTLEGTDLTAQTIVRVKEKQVYPVVATPVASLPSGSTVEAGTQVTLTCETENARIWYTLDGSCPCVSGNRILYTEPIVLQEGDVTLKVMADAEGYIESEVATYTYHVVGSTSIITIGEALFATYVAPFDVDITTNESVKAYAVTAINDGRVTITETLAVPAGEAVVVRADEAGKYHVQKTTNAAIGTNLLKPAIEAIEAVEAGRLYVLTDGVDGVGFYPVVVGKTIPAGNGYLEVTAGGANFYPIGEIIDDVKGLVIEGLDGTHTIYNLNGQRIGDSRLKPGIYIVNGNKIVIK